MLWIKRNMFPAALSHVCTCACVRQVCECIQRYVYLFDLFDCSIVYVRSVVSLEEARRQCDIHNSSSEYSVVTLV